MIFAEAIEISGGHPSVNESLAILRGRLEVTVQTSFSEVKVSLTRKLDKKLLV